MNQPGEKIPCPTCGAGELTSVATAPFARGFLIAYQQGTKKIIGCRPCVANGLRMEAGKSLLFGWFSITALLANIFFIPWNFLRSFFVSEDDLAVSKFFDDVGVPRPGTEYRITDAFHHAAASLICADGKIDPAEVNAAKSIGMQMLDDFSTAELDRLLEQKGRVRPLAEIATVFRVYLNANGHTMILKYLISIAIADGDFAKSEEKLIKAIAKEMGISKQHYAKFRDELFAA
jgi:uncharacterized tellurite resistance protein B-like protein